MTKKRIGIYLLISFGLVWGVMIPFFVLGGEYRSAEAEFILCFSMLCPAIATVITGKLTKEGLSVTGKDSLMLGISLKNKICSIFYRMSIPKQNSRTVSTI